MPINPDMHGKECDIEADKHQPEIPTSQRSFSNFPGELGQPIIKGGKDRENHAADQDVMKVRDHKIQNRGPANQTARLRSSRR